ncbi:sigma-54 dependent transcriptional regulator [Bacteriovorax sp. Seq25_V]|uniref:sigma-54-dependent transcriptional regulator n=1 Tax=Bacteriovorax sp. Seq25_V TaxID=1201288 RepID=UPI00038A415F|nr:sigma 54-interacting transcriptional regulator [Bacteriovorax sp. Seq25_V]EQC44794.1 sigma-54 interaction domain protein [Bacteriovorax sp. Seq25_V]
MNTLTAEYFGQDPKIVKAVKVARNVAVTKVPVLVVGEAGVGKKTLAKFIHENSTRANKPFVTVDCGTGSTQVENEILGYREAESGRFVKGALENANGGTVVLVNIDALEEDFQKKLHKILGELDDYDIDLRIIATTTKNLSKLVGAGRFYRGLYTNLSNNSITLTPLRERINDIEVVANNIIKDCFEGSVSIEEAALQKLVTHYWTHNVKELKAVLESSLVNFDGDVLSEEQLEIGEKKVVNVISEEDSEGIRLMSLKEAERLLIKKALVHTSENRTQAAKILGVSIRTLRNKINEYRTEGNSYFVNLR